MKTVGVRALRENPGILSQSAAKGEFVLLTNRNEPMSLSVPFNDDLLDAGVNINLAIKLYEEGLLTLAKAAKLSKMPVEAFLNKLGCLGIVVVDQSAKDISADLDILNG
ncbi:MAG: UPF0175 family protein [Pseudomonadota bacterium]